jgi:choloylglycine hydrolase
MHGNGHGRDRLIRLVKSGCLWLFIAGCAVPVVGNGAVGDGPAKSGAGCSAVSVNVDGRSIFGANLDYRLHTRGQLFINRRGIHKTGIITGAGGYATWVSRYASLTFNFVGYQFAWAGMNERGLAMSTMALPQTVVQPPDERPVVDSGMWMQYVLDTCATVEDVIASDELVRNITVDHYLVADRSGAAATIEYVDGELVVHTGDDLPVSVLSNWFYDESLQWWRVMRGSGDYSRVDGVLQRFCLAADRVSAFRPSTSTAAVSYVFDTLETIAGERFSEHASQWSIVFDTGSSKIYFKTLAHPEIKWVDLAKVNRYCNRGVEMMEIQTPHVGDVRPLFTQYSHEAALDHFYWFLDSWETTATRQWARQILAHFEGFTCQPMPAPRRGAERH